MKLQKGGTEIGPRNRRNTRKESDNRMSTQDRNTHDRVEKLLEDNAALLENEMALLKVARRLLEVRLARLESILRMTLDQTPVPTTYASDIATEAIAAEPEKPLVSIQEMADYLGLSRSTFQRIAKTPGFPVFRTGRIVKYPWREVVAFVAQAAREGRDLRATSRRPRR